MTKKKNGQSNNVYTDILVFTLLGILVFILLLVAIISILGAINLVQAQNAQNLQLETKHFVASTVDQDGNLIAVNIETTLQSVSRSGMFNMSNTGKMVYRDDAENLVVMDIYTHEVTQLPIVEHSGNHFGFEWSPNGELLASRLWLPPYATYQAISIWNLETDQFQIISRQSEQLIFQDWYTNNQILVTICNGTLESLGDCRLSLLDITTSQETVIVYGNYQGQISDNGVIVYHGGEGIYLATLSSQAPRYSIDSDSFFSGTISSDGRHVMWIGDSRHIYHLDTQTLETTSILHMGENGEAFGPIYWYDGLIHYTTVTNGQHFSLAADLDGMNYATYDMFAELPVIHIP